MISRKIIPSLLTIAVFFIAFSFSANPAAAQDNSIIEIVESSENHTIFANLLEETGLSERISDDGPYTVIAPTDNAFESMGDKLEEVKNSPDMMQNVVSGHLYEGKVDSSDVEAAIGVKITNGNIDASNGYVHISDEVVDNNQ